MENARKCSTFGTTYVLNICVHSVTAGFHSADVAKVKKGIRVAVVLLLFNIGIEVELK